MHDYDTYKIKQVSIIDIAKRLGIVVKKNTALCCFHDEKTASLKFDNKKGLYYCFGCGAKGNSITLVSKCLNKSFLDSCQWIEREFYGNYTGIKYSPVIIRKLGINKTEESTNQPNSEIYEWIIENTSLSSSSESYLTHERGFNTETINALKIRDISNLGEFNKKALDKWGAELLIKAGLCKRDGNDTLKYVWWDHVIIFPFTNTEGRIDYIQARRLVSDKPKYLNLFDMQSTIYNWICLNGLKKGDTVTICEGVPDTISAITKGRNAVGILGALAFKEQWVKHFLNFEIDVIPDNDKAGVQFGEKLRQAFKKAGKPIRVIQLPKIYKDLNELHRGNYSNR